MKEIRAEIITIGNELLAGYTVNTNATFISQQLLLTGLSVSWVTTIRDDAHEILTALETAGNRAEVVLISGGLGPTPDDITKQTICSYFDTELVFDESVFENIRNILQRRKLHLLESNRKQALVPASAEIIQNGAGTAPGLILKKKGTTYIFMPGVPQELQLMMQNTVPSYLKSVLELPSIHTHLLRTTGITEAGLYEQIRDIVDNEDRFPLSFLPDRKSVV